MKPGPKPRPTTIKLVKGTRKDRVNQNEPQLPPGDTAPPPELEGRALEEWNRLVVQLSAEGLFTVVDRAALACYCISWANMVMYEEKCAEVGPELAIAKGFRKAAQAERALVLRFAAEFGFSPSSRSRVTVRKADGGKNDPFAKFFDGKKA